MCRHVAYVGPPVGLASVLLDAPHALVRQVREPRCQLPGVVNEDGWGVAWWADGQLRQHRSTVPLPDDAAGQELLRATTTSAFVAAVRRASPGASRTETGNAPFVEEGWAFSLNGFVGGYFDAGAGAGEELRAQLSPARRGRLAGDADSEVLFGLVLDRLDAGVAPADALADATVAALDAAAGRPSRLNLVLADGERVWATRHANSLFSRRGVIASEPWDDEPGWVEVPDASQVDVHPLV